MSDEDEDDLPLVTATDLSGMFDEFMEMDGEHTGIDPDHLRLGFSAGASAMVTLLASRIVQRTQDMGGVIKTRACRALAR